MLRTIILALIGFILIALLTLWILSGGPRKVFTNVKTSINENIENATPSVEDPGFRLPWQPIQLFPTLDIAGALDLTDESATSDPQARLIQLEAEYDRLKSEVDQSRSFGTPSPYAGKVGIIDDASGIRAENSKEEYLQIGASYTNTDSIDVTGWTLESALTGARIALSPAASPYIANGASALTAVLLTPGARAIIATAPSPIGVSFRENMCSGYLGQFQQFTPPLSPECPSPSEILPLNEQNLLRYGDSCFDEIRNMSQCQFPQSLSSSVSGACRAYLTEYLSYNGCVTLNRTRAAFQSNVWRIFLGSSSDLWRDSHDAIRLLDREGRTVSVFVY